MITVFLSIDLLLFFSWAYLSLNFFELGEFKELLFQNPYLNREGIACSVCGKTVTSEFSCDKNETEVTKIMNEF